jgi:hypothetical protein
LYISPNHRTIHYLMAEFEHFFNILSAFHTPVLSCIQLLEGEYEIMFYIK